MTPNEIATLRDEIAKELRSIEHQRENLAAKERRALQYLGLLDGVCTARADYMGRPHRCFLPFEHMGNHATHVPGGEMRWTLVVKS